MGLGKGSLRISVGVVFVFNWAAGTQVVIVLLLCVPHPFYKQPAGL